MNAATASFISLKIPIATAAATTCGTATWPKPFYSLIHRGNAYYREFEVSPNGMWIDLDIFPGGLADLKSGLKKSVFLDEKAHALDGGAGYSY